MTHNHIQTDPSYVSTASPVLLASPVMTREKFSESSGLREGQIRGQMLRGHLPVFNIGRLAMVNVALLTWSEIHLVPCPIMTKDAFAKASGLREQQVESQLDKGNLPRRDVGRLALVDVAELVRQCMAQQDSSRSY
ncbi:hypothetical protein MO867_18935 [Microbulbifer sp. OS29]|uniref:Uncharacterized protein n=1 Tax=Microbulbifer okhotskensis TaxID=2926617 RepID=A0A9X2EV02_9GAMM|nr:hypothetical protein [Microbulbifer okhotskensis]MCO1336413.1 hypothetical protein [Microbulbifer okhotskensis]